MARPTRIKQWKFKRYLPFIKYSSFNKGTNLVIALFSWLAGKTIISSKPAFLRIEISRKCNVKCLYCSEIKENIFYPLDRFRCLINELKSYIYIVSLYEVGEPLENENVIDYIRYAGANNIGTIISTNLSIQKTDEFWESLVLSGLDRIIIAIDGITAPVYNRYRTNGDLQLVLSNLDKILYYKKLHIVPMKIEWQMIDFPWNRHEQAPARAMALRLNCDEFRVIQEVTAVRNRYKAAGIKRNRNCILPYFTFNVTAYNTVRSCTKNYDDPMQVGDLNAHTVSEIWNGPEICRIRSPQLISHRPGCRTCLE
jgi:hypothetical protein